jgi:hypothetical protein
MRPSSLRAPIEFAAVSCALLACGTGDDGANRAGGTRLAEWTLGESVVQLGGSAGTGPEVFSELRHVLLSPDASVYLVDSKTTGVLRFRDDGTFVNEIGRVGDGPGEFRWISDLGLRHDTLWVADSRNRRRQFFSPDGALAGSQPWKTWNVPTGPRQSRSVQPRGLFREDLGLAHVPTLSPLPDAPSAPGHGTVGPLAFHDTSGIARDTIAWLAQGSELFLIDMQAKGYLHFPGPNHFIETPLWNVAPDGSLIAVVDRPAPKTAASAAYRVRVWSGRGEPRFTVDVQYEPVPVEQRTVDSIINVFADDMDEAYASMDEALGIVRDSLRPPAFYPPVTDIVFATDGAIWLAREGLATPPFDARRYDVIDAAGRPAGWLRLRRPGKIMAATATDVWVVELDADDVPTLQRYPVIRRPAP